MTAIQYLAWLQAISTLVSGGINVVSQIPAILKSFHPGLSDADLNTISASIAASASTHLALAEADAGIAPAKAGA